VFSLKLNLVSGFLTNFYISNLYYYRLAFFSVPDGLIIYA